MDNKGSQLSGTLGGFRVDVGRTVMTVGAEVQ